MNAVKLARVITELKKISKHGEVTLEEFTSLVKTIPDEATRNLLNGILESSGDEDKLKALVIDLLQEEVPDDDDLNDLAAVVLNVI